MDALTVAGRARSALANVKAILFDKDGTLLDFDATWAPATQEVLRTLSGGDPARLADLARSCGFDPAARTFDPASPIIGGYTDDFAPAWAASLGRTYDDAFRREVDRLFREASLRHVTAYDDVASVLGELRRRGFPLGIATNDSEETARLHLEAVGMTGSFDFVAGYDSGYGGKPGNGMVVAFARRNGLATEDVALVGDSPHDIEAARSAGAVAIGIARTDRAATVLSGLSVVTIEDLRQLLAALDGSGPPAVVRRA